MIWGAFGAVHLLSLALSAAMILLLYLFLKKRSEKVQGQILFVLSFAGIGAIAFNLLQWGSPLEYLPLHLCSLAALLLPFAVKTNNRTVNNLLLLWGLGALIALVLNTEQANYKVFSWTFAFYYIPHTLEAGLVWLQFALKRAKLDAKCIPSTLGITLGAYALVHGINVLINNYCQAHQVLDWAGNVIKVNYMFSITPTNPLLQAIYTRPYWYMFGILPIILVYLGLVYHKQLLKKKKA